MPLLHLPYLFAYPLFSLSTLFPYPPFTPTLSLHLAFHYIYPLIIPALSLSIPFCPPSLHRYDPASWKKECRRVLPCGLLTLIQVRITTPPIITLTTSNDIPTTNNHPTPTSNDIPTSIPSLTTNNYLHPITFPFLFFSHHSRESLFPFDMLASHQTLCFPHLFSMVA